MLSELEAGLGYTFRDKSILENALTHSSYANENRERGLHDNERLEFLGDSIVSDAMESVIAASYMDGGFSAAKEIIDRLILSDVPAGKPHNFDYKTALQELVQRKKDQVLRYELTGESGPDHDKKFEVEVLLNGKPCGNGSGSSKKRAEQAAAAAAIDALFPGEL